MRHVDSLHELLDFVLTVSTLLGKTMLIESVCRSYVFRIGNRELSTDLILLGMNDFDVILGMDWFEAHHATIHCYLKEVVYHLPISLSFFFSKE